MVNDLLRSLLAAAALSGGLFRAPPLTAQAGSRPTSTLADTGTFLPIAEKHARRILGVFDAQSGNPLEGAEVVDLFVDNVYRTKANGLIGLWVFESRRDSVAVRVRKIGYADTAFVVMTGTNDTTPVPIYLVKATTLPAFYTEARSADDMLASLHLTPNMREFEERKNDRSLSGRFIGTQEMRRQDSKPIGDIIYDLSSGKSRGCRNGPKIYVDGRPAVLPSDTLSVTGNDFEAAEFYTMASTPLRFGGTAQPSGKTVSAASASDGRSAPTFVAGAAGPAGASGSIGGDAALGCGTILLWRREKS